LDFGVAEHAIADPLVQELRCHEIDAAPTHESRKLLLQPDEGQARHMASLELHEDVDVTLWPEVVAQHRAEHGQPPDVVPPAEGRDLLTVDGDPCRHGVPGESNVPFLGGAPRWRTSGQG
jgi:hypothetical protein